VVLGHEGCGAIQAALETKDEGVRQHSRIQLLVDSILPRRPWPNSRVSWLLEGGKGRNIDSWTQFRPSPDPMVSAPVPRGWHLFKRSQ